MKEKEVVKIAWEQYYACVQQLTDQVIRHETFRMNGEYEHENPDVTVMRYAAYLLNKLIKRCDAAEQNRDYFEELVIKTRRRATGKWEEVEVMHIETDDELCGFEAIASARCTQCNHYHNEIYRYGRPLEMARFCPFCGAEMQKGEE